MTRYKLALPLIALLLLLTPSCSKESFDYSSFHAYFVFNNSIHQNTVLQTAVNPMSPGVFCRIYEVTQGKAVYIYFESNQGGDPAPSQLNELEVKQTRMLGLYNKTGIIVGYGNLSSTPVFYVYDSQCPNCYRETNTMAYKLNMGTNGIAICPKCNRKYDLNNNGLCANGRKLEKYRGSCTGPLGVLNVHN